MRATYPVLVLVLAIIAMMGATFTGMSLGFLCQCHGKPVVSSQAFCEADHVHLDDWQHEPHSHEPHSPISEEVILVPIESLAAPAWVPLEIPYLNPSLGIIRSLKTFDRSAPPLCSMGLKSHPIQHKRQSVLLI